MYQQNQPTSNELKVFEGNEVEAIERNGAVLFNPYHVGRCLDIGESAIRDHLSKMGGTQAVLLKNSDVDSTDIRKLNNAGEKFLTESGVYKLVFKSRKPGAEKFTDWIADEVLPAIRKTGGYRALPRTYVEALEALLASEKEKARLAGDRALLEAKVCEMAPKAAFFDAVADSPDAIDMGEAAKVLNMGLGRNGLFAALRERGVLMRDNIPYQEFIDRGYFRTIEQRYSKPDGSVHIGIKTVVYQKGLEFMRRALALA